MRPAVYLFLSLVFLSFDAFADPGSRKPASSLTLADLRPPSESTASDRKEIQKKMVQPVSFPEARPRVAKPPLEGNSPGDTTFGVSISR